MQVNELNTGNGTMANETKANLSHAKSMVANKAVLRQILEEQDQRTGFIPDPTATPQKARELMMEQGVRPEDNAFSCEIRRMREGTA
jgi:hypothetical protein